MSQRHYGYQRYKLFCRASRGYGLYLKIANLKFIVFTLNQRVQGSSPCAPTNLLRRLGGSFQKSAERLDTFTTFNLSDVLHAFRHPLLADANFVLVDHSFP